MKEPCGLPHQKAAVLRMESSSFCQLVSEKSSRLPVSSRLAATRSTSYVHQSPKPVLVQSGASSSASSILSSRSSFPPRQRDTTEELDAMRSKGICFKCKGKYFRGHVCPLKELQILTVVDGLELEVIDDELSVMDEVVVDEQPVMRCLSLNSFLGKHSPHTTKLLGRIGKKTIVVLLDS